MAFLENLEKVPQAWETGAVFLLLQGCLGISFHGTDREIRFTHAFLPEFLPAIQIKNIRKGLGRARIYTNRIRCHDQCDSER